MKDRSSQIAMGQSHSFNFSNQVRERAGNTGDLYNFIKHTDTVPPPPAATCSLSAYMMRKLQENRLFNCLIISKHLSVLSNPSLWANFIKSILMATLGGKMKLLNPMKEEGVVLILPAAFGLIFRFLQCWYSSFIAQIHLTFMSLWRQDNYCAMLIHKIKMLLIKIEERSSYDP